MKIRPRAWEIEHIVFGQEKNDEVYAARVVARELECFAPWRNVSPEENGELIFRTDRTVIGKMAYPYLLALLRNVEDTIHVLEIGGGQGKALLYLKNLLHFRPELLPRVHFTLTSLTAEPEHEALLKQGMELRIPQIAESLPVDWKGTRNLILTSALLGWVDMEATIYQINQTLVSGGYWLGLESYNGAPLNSDEYYQPMIERAMKNNGMKNSVSEKEYAYWVKDQGLFPVAYLKE
jgi:hypothetical protein